MPFALPQELPPIALPVEHVPTLEAQEPPELDEYALAEQKARAEQDAVLKAETAEKVFLEEQATPEAPVDPLLQDIEKILAIDLDGTFKELPEEVKTRFLSEGQTLAHRILAGRAETKPSNVIEWIRKWLHQIPKVNKTFLAQDAKIKTDALLALFRAQALSPA